MYVCVYAYMCAHTHICHAEVWLWHPGLPRDCAPYSCSAIVLLTIQATLRFRPDPRELADRNCHGFILRRQKEKGRLHSLPLKMPPRGSTPLLFTSPQEESSYMITQLQARLTETSVYSEWSPHPANITMLRNKEVICVRGSY